MIERTNFQIKKDNEELFSVSTGMHSFHCLYADKKSLIENTLPWHWHAAFEIDYIEGCDVQFNFIGNSVCIPKGSAVFINSGAIHSYQPKNPDQCKIYAFIFETNFLAGSYEDPIYIQYIAPILHADFTHLMITPEITPYQKMITSIKNILHTSSKEPAYYELKLRSELESFWCMLLDSLKSTGSFFHSQNRDRDRIKKMLHFIHSNYSQQISLNDIAVSGMIGTRECSRCFQRSIGRSPMDYLNNYRIQMAVQQLLTTDKTISEISECNGFSSISYFGKVFRQYTGASPLQYRSSASISSVSSKENRIAFF